MNILEQIENFVKTGLSKNAIVTLGDLEISDIMSHSGEHIMDACQRIMFTVTLKDMNNKHIFHVDINTHTIKITDDSYIMKTVALPTDKKYRIVERFY